MRIAHLISSLNVGGAENLVIDIANTQSKAHLVALVVFNDAYCRAMVDALHPRVERHLIARPPGSRNPWYAVKLLLTLRKFGPDIIHCHNASFIAVLHCMPRPKVLTLHDTRTVLPGNIAKFNAIYSISSAVKADLASTAPHVPSTVVWNGIRIDSIVRKTKYAQTPFRIVQISRILHEKKGQDTLLRAVARVQELLGQGAVSVDFIGGCSTPECVTSLEFLRSLAIELGVNHCCRFLGEMPRGVIHEQLAGYDLLVQPSRYEGFGLTIVEAMIARVPVLVTGIEGPMEIIQEGKYGAYFPENDHEQCAREIMTIMERSGSPLVVAELQEIEKYAQEKFDVRTTADVYVDEYQKIKRT